MAKRTWRPQHGENVSWTVPNFRRVVKQEFLAHARKYDLTAAGLLEDVLRDYLASQGIHIDERTERKPLPPQFTKKGVTA